MGRAICTGWVPDALRRPVRHIIAYPTGLLLWTPLHYLKENRGLLFIPTTGNYRNFSPQSHLRTLLRKQLKHSAILIRILSYIITPMIIFTTATNLMLIVLKKWFQ